VPTSAEDYKRPDHRPAAEQVSARHTDWLDRLLRSADEAMYRSKNERKLARAKS
jgi:hypothetical protein